MKLNLEAKTQEERKVKAYLEANASEVLSQKINNGVRIQKDGKTLLNKKTLAGFMKYACDQAKKQAEKGAHSACIDDDVVYGWAIHYFEESSIEGILYNEDGSEYKKQPSVAAKAPTVKALPKPQPKPQMSMFDLMGENLESTPAPVEEKSDDDEDDMPSEEEIQEIMAELAEEEKAEPKPTVFPMYQEYLDVQSKYPHSVIAMRLGDFYEVFGKNAELLADKLPLTLTSRDVGLESRLPMVGFPYHASDTYLKKILGYGYGVVLIETDGHIHTMPDERDVDLETGEILTEEEMRKFDGDIEEPGFTDSEPDLDLSAFDTEVLAILDGMFGNEITVR